MSDLPLSIAPRNLVRPVAVALGVMAVIALAVHAPAAHLPGAAWAPHWPQFGALGHASLAIRIHLAAVLAAFVIGTVLMLGRKGRTLHKLLGWSFSGLMTVTAASSLFIHVLNPRGFSVLHLFSGWTLIVLPFAILAARRHRARAHARAMTSLYLGGLVVAGLFTFVPGRLMWQVFFG
jgi:uncharacterized membrane protein